LFIQFSVAGQYRFFEIIAVDTVDRDKLHTAVCFAVVKQDAVAVFVAVGTKLSDKAVNSLYLLGCDLHHRPFLLSFSGNKKAAGFPTALP
jgi:hypothetical protein